MKLRDLDAHFIDSATPQPNESFCHENNPPLSAAQGLLFLCPLCFARNGGAAGTHSILIPFKDRCVPPGFEPTLPRWAASGSGIDDLTISPSIDLSSDGAGHPRHEGCAWHGFVRNGDAA